MKEKLHNSWHIFSLVMTRLVLPLLILFWAGSYIATQIDKYHVRQAPATDYVRYTSFTVNGAYEGEDVNFTVCREFKDRYHYDGDLGVYIIPNPDKPEKAQKVYSRAIGSTYNNQPCEAKRIKEVDFHHAPGSYAMSFRVCFPVKYGYQKCTDDVKSNVYRIRVRPNDANSQIEYYENLINQLKQDGTDPGSLAPITKSQPTTNNTTNNVTNSTINNPAPVETKKPVKVVGIPICVPLSDICVTR